MHPTEANESSIAAASIHAVGGCVRGCGMRTKIDESGCRRFLFAINVGRHDSGAIVGCCAVKRSGV